MKIILTIVVVPFMVLSSLIVIGTIAVIKAVEESHDDDLFWE